MIQFSPEVEFRQEQKSGAKEQLANAGDSLETKGPFAQRCHRLPNDFAKCPNNGKPLVSQGFPR
jgi:hypothetical protein